MIRPFLYLLATLCVLFVFTMCKKTNPMEDDIPSIDTTRVGTLPINDSLEVDTNVVDTLVNDTIETPPIYVNGLCVDIVPDTNCVEIPSPGDFGYFYEYMDLDYSRASFNPNNNQELVCFRHRDGLRDGLVILNTKTQNVQILLEEQILDHPKWSEKGWIVFSRLDHQIWKIRSDGGDLTQLTLGAEGWNSLPSWINNGKGIVFESTRDLHNGRLFTMDENGKNVEMLPNTKACSFAVMSKNDKYLIYSRTLPSAGTIEIMNMETNEQKVIRDLDKPSLVGAVWHPLQQDVVVWSEYESMYVMNVTTEEIVQLKRDCSSRRYRYFDFRSDASAFIYNLELTSSLPERQEVLFNHQIIEMDLCGQSTVLVE